jgi:hypothetical protein
VNFSVSDPAQVDLSPASHRLVFTPENFNNASHSILVTAKNDGIVDGTKNVSITLSPAVSADRQWNGINPSDVFVTVLDKAATP